MIVLDSIISSLVGPLGIAPFNKYVCRSNQCVGKESRVTAFSRHFSERWQQITEGDEQQNVQYNTFQA